MTTEMKVKRNKRLLLKTAKRIEKVPESYHQGWWATKDPSAPCGTTACIAGETLICSERKVSDGLNKLWRSLHNFTVSDQAENLLGLTDYESGIVFDGTASRWPQPFHKQYHQAKTQRGQANAAAALLRYLADGGKL